MAAAIEAHGAPDTMHNPNSVGDFTTPTPGGDDFCQVPTFPQQGEQQLPFIPAVPPIPPDPDAGPDAEGTPGVPAVPGQNIKYDWSNVRVLVRPTANGTQLAGDLTVTTDTTADPDAGAAHCTATYRVQALFNPNQVACGKAVDGGEIADFCQCLPYSDPDNGRSLGSGLSPDLFGPQPPASAACELDPGNAAALEAASKVQCHPELHLCVLKNDPPQ